MAQTRTTGAAMGWPWSSSRQNCQRCRPRRTVRRSRSTPPPSAGSSASTAIRRRRSTGRSSRPGSAQRAHTVAPMSGWSGCGTGRPV